MTGGPAAIHGRVFQTSIFKNNAVYKNIHIHKKKKHWKPLKALDNDARPPVNPCVWSHRQKKNPGLSVIAEVAAR